MLPCYRSFMSERGRKFSVIYFLFQLLVLILVVLIMVEALTRKLVPLPAPGDRLLSFSVAHPELGWVNQPGAMGRVHYTVDSHTREVAVHVNAAGYRGPEFAEAKEQKQIRVAIVGGSTVFGMGVHENETFSALFSSSNTDLEVQNFGVLGHSLDQSIMLFEQEVVEKKPAVALLTVKEREPDRSYASVAQPKFLLQGNRPVLASTGKRSLGGTGTTALLKELALKHLVVSRHVARFFEDKRRQKSRSEEVDTILVEAMINRFLSACRKSGIKAFVLLVPTAVSGTGPSEFQSKVVATCEAAQGCSIINPYPAFNQAALDRSALFIEDQLRLSDIGHFLLAREIKATLSASQ